MSSFSLRLLFHDCVWKNFLGFYVICLWCLWLDSSIFICSSNPNAKKTNRENCIKLIMWCVQTHERVIVSTFQKKKKKTVEERATCEWCILLHTRAREDFYFIDGQFSLVHHRACDSTKRATFIHTHWMQHTCILHTYINTTIAIARAITIK